MVKHLRSLELGELTYICCLKATLDFNHLFSGDHLGIRALFLFIFKNQIKSLLLSHHHSTSALVSEILMSVLQTVQKKQQTIYLWTDSAKKTTNNLPMDRQCKKTTNNLPMDRQCKKNNKQFTYGQTVQKTALEHLQCSRQCKKTTTAIYIWTDSAKKTTAIYIWTDSAKNNSNLHMDSTYLQTVQKTMCKIHIHALSTLSVL